MEGTIHGETTAHLAVKKPGFSVKLILGKSGTSLGKTRLGLGYVPIMSHGCCTFPQVDWWPWFGYFFCANSRLWTEWGPHLIWGPWISTDFWWSNSPTATLDPGFWHPTRSESISRDVQILFFHHFCLFVNHYGGVCLTCHPSLRMAPAWWARRLAFWSPKSSHPPLDWRRGGKVSRCLELLINADVTHIIYILTY